MSHINEYTIFKIPKHSGGYRVIESPNPELMKKQKDDLNKRLYKLLPISPFAHGFVKNKSIVTNALPHVGKKYIMKFDIENFFPSITGKLFQATFTTYFYDTYSEMKKNVFKRRIKFFRNDESILSTYNERYKIISEVGKDIIKLHFMQTEGNEDNGTLSTYRLPQGAPASPHISNFILRGFDWGVGLFLIALNDKHPDANLEYSRYADDITISGDICMIDMFKDKLSTMLRSYDLELNEKKIKCISRKYQQRVCGIVVNDKVALPKATRNKIRALKYKLKNGEIELTPQIQGLFAVEEMVKNQRNMLPDTLNNIMASIKLSNIMED